MKLKKYHVVVGLCDIVFILAFKLYFMAHLTNTD